MLNEDKDQACPRTATMEHYKIEKDGDKYVLSRLSISYNYLV